MQAGVTKYQYNSKGLLAYVVNPGGEVVSYSYDDYGRKAELRYPDGRTVRYSYDEMDRLAAVTGLDGESTRYSYDGNGNMVQKTLGNRVDIPICGCTDWWFILCGRISYGRRCTK